MCAIGNNEHFSELKTTGFREFHITVNIYQSDKPDTINCREKVFYMSGIEKSPLTRLVLFMVCLSIAGAFVAGGHYYVIDVPQQKALSGYPPANANTDIKEKCDTCTFNCLYGSPGNYYACLGDCENIC